MSSLPVSWRGNVIEEWIDRNGHFNVGYYMVAFDEATTRFFDYCGLDDEHRRRFSVATFTAESHATYERELVLGDPIRITTQLIAATARKIHYFHRMFHEEKGYLAATNELLSLQVDTRSRRITDLEPVIRTRLDEILRLQGDLAIPSRAGRRIGVDASRPAADEA
jgi:acyl-CoA thioester hydrolase